MLYSKVLTRETKTHPTWDVRGACLDLQIRLRKQTTKRLIKGLIKRPTLYEQKLKHETYTHPTSNLCGPCLDLQMRSTKTNHKETHRPTHTLRQTSVDPFWTYKWDPPKQTIKRLIKRPMLYTQRLTNEGSHWYDANTHPIADLRGLNLDLQMRPSYTLRDAK